VRLQVAMNDALGMRGRQSIGYGCADRDGLAPGDRALLQALLQCLAFQQLGYGEGDSLLGAHVEQRQNVRVGECGYGFGLSLKARQGHRTFRQPFRQYFYRDIPVQSRIARTIDFTHAAGANRGEDLVRAQS